MSRPAKPLVVQTEELDATCAAWLAERCELVACPSEDSRFPDLIRRADGLVVRTYTRVGPSLLEIAPRLKVVGRAGVGLDNIDVPACKSRGVTVVSTPDANTRAVTELVFAFILDALRPRVFLEHPLTMAEWKRARGELIAPRQLSDLTLGILGLGRVGKSVARIGAALRMRVLYTDLLDIPEAERCGASSTDVDTLFRESDVLTLHIDGRASNRKFVSAERLDLCKRDVLLINASRGMVLDSIALAAFLWERPEAQAVLDVHEPEPFGPDYPLLSVPNAHLAPHIGAATATAHRNMSWVVRDVWRVLAGETPEFPA
ncbi:MAG: NAD(P)-dependent oxidoreductase [Phycisphaerales bacterium]